MEVTGPNQTPTLAMVGEAQRKAEACKGHLATQAKTLKLEAALFAGGMLLLMGGAAAGCYLFFGRGGYNFSPMTMAGGTALAFLPALAFGGVVEVDLIRRYVNEYRPAKEEHEKAVAEYTECFQAYLASLDPTQREKQE